MRVKSEKNNHSSLITYEEGGFDRRLFLMYKQFVVIFGLIFVVSHHVFAQSALPHTFSNVEMSVTDFGAFAAISGGNLTYNFRYPASEESSVTYLHPYSEIWIGDTKGNIATGFDYDLSLDEFVFGDFQVTQDGKLQYVSESKSRQTIRTQYATIPEMELPFDLLIDQISYSWKKADYPDAADFIVMKLVITNTKSIDLNDVYIAISTNWDIDLGDSNLDLADWDEDRKAGFMYDADDSDGLDSAHTAVVLLNGKFHACRILPFLIGQNINVNPYLDSKRSEIMSSAIIDRKEDFASPGNYMNIMVAGPYDIPRTKSIMISFAFVAGDGLDDLQKNINEAYRITYAPDQLTVTPEDRAVKLEWSQPINHSVAGYHVMRRAEQSEYVRVNSSTISEVIYEDKGLENGVRYYYKIRPVNMYVEEFVINGITMESIEKSVIPNPIPLALELDAEEIYGEKIKLTWTKTTDKNIANYILFRNHTGEPPWAKIAEIDDLTLTSFVDENVYPGIDYYYTIAAVSTSEVQSELSKPVFVKLEKETTPSPKEDLENVFAAPNPCNLSATDNGIVFMNLTKHAEIRIYTSSGELVKTIYHRNDKLTDPWDCKNDRGNLISAGTYIYYITAWTSGKDGELIAGGKFSILR